MTSSGPLWSMAYRPLVCTKIQAPAMFSAISTPTTRTAAPRIIAIPPTSSKSTLAGPDRAARGTPASAKSRPTPARLPPKSYSSSACITMSTPRPTRATSRPRSRAVWGRAAYRTAPVRSVTVMVVFPRGGRPRVTRSMALRSSV